MDQLRKQSIPWVICQTMIWEFLNGKPVESEVIETFGFPDSVWLDDEQSTKFLYYYVSKIRDYNTIEISKY